MQIYPIETTDGLADLLKNNKLSIACQLFEPTFKPESKVRDLIIATAKANPNQRDLFYKHSILASIGWNANDDVFDRFETWEARNTPVDKQINYMHNELDIIGHSTSSFIYDESGKLIPDNTPFENLPEKFDVVTEFVLYSMWDSPERQQMMGKLIAEINDGKWFVSMECRFPEFDYAIIDRDGSHKTIARNENTAFLTKYLRAYGGSGEYEGRRIGRLIKKLFFSGQAIVDNPANSRSIIFNNAISFNSKGSLIIKGNEKMEEELKKQIAELKSQLNDTNKKQFEETIASLQEELKASKAAFEDMKKKKDDSEKDSEEKCKAFTSTITEKDSAIATLTKDLKDATDKLTVASAEIASIRKDQAFAARAAKMVAAGLADEVAKTEATKWAGLDDAQFDDIVAMHKVKIEAEKKAAAGVTTTVTEKTQAELDKAEADKNATLNTSDAAKVEKEMEAISAAIGKSMPFSSRAKKLEQSKK